MPGVAPESGDRMKISLPPGPAARTMPSDIPNFILRGFRLATITVKRPSRSSGLYADLIPANTLRSPCPTSRVRRRSLSAPSTCSALTIFATRRSTLAKSGNSISSATGSRSCRLLIGVAQCRWQLFFRGIQHFLDLHHVDPVHQGLELVDAMIFQKFMAAIPVKPVIQERF